MFVRHRKKTKGEKNMTDKEMEYVFLEKCAKYVFYELRRDLYE